MVIRCLGLIRRFAFIGVVAAVSGLVLTVAASEGSAHNDYQEPEPPTVEASLLPRSVRQGSSSTLILKVTNDCVVVNGRSGEVSIQVSADPGVIISPPSASLPNPVFDGIAEFNVDTLTTTVAGDHSIGYEAQDTGCLGETKGEVTLTVTELLTVVPNLEPPEVSQGSSSTLMLTVANACFVVNGGPGKVSIEVSADSDLIVTPGTDTLDSPGGIVEFEVATLATTGAGEHPIHYEVQDPCRNVVEDDVTLTVTEEAPPPDGETPSTDETVTPTPPGGPDGTDGDGDSDIPLDVIVAVVIGAIGGLGAAASAILLSRSAVRRRPTIGAHKDKLAIKLANRPGSGSVSSDDLTIVLGIAGRLYRMFRLFQLAETGVRLRDLTDDSAFIDRWFQFSEAAVVKPSPDRSRAIDWVGGLTVRQAQTGSFFTVLQAFGKGAGEGLAAAVRGVADALTTLVTAPAEFRKRWAEGRGLDADAKMREAEAAARQARVDSREWAREVMRGERSATPEQFHYALEVLTQAGIVSRQFADDLIRRLSGEVEVVSRLAEARVLA